MGSACEVTDANRLQQVGELQNGWGRLLTMRLALTETSPVLWDISAFAHLGRCCLPAAGRHEALIALHMPQLGHSHGTTTVTRAVHTSAQRWGYLSVSVLESSAVLRGNLGANPGLFTLMNKGLRRQSRRNGICDLTNYGMECQRPLWHTLIEKHASQMGSKGSSVSQSRGPLRPMPLLLGWLESGALLILGAWGSMLGLHAE